MSFRMQLASLSGDASAYVPLSFTNAGEVARRPSNPVLARTVGNELEYGHLFAYLFRRFGYPNQAWERPTELCRYLLTTPRDDLLLRVLPQADGCAERSLEFLGPQDVVNAARLHLGKRQWAWECRALAHRGARGMPRWLDARVRARAKAVCEDAEEASRGGRIEEDAPQAWRESLCVAPTDTEPSIRRVSAFLEQCCDAYGVIEEPPPQARPQDPSDWDELDPLKSYALAAIAALNSLMREVKLGDSAIDVFGARPASRRALEAAPGAGVACGALVNPRPDLYAELASRIAVLGRGDERQGLMRALALLQAEGAH